MKSVWKDPMLKWLAQIRLTSGGLPIALFALTALALVVLVVIALLDRRFKDLLRQVGMGIICGAVGLLLAWLLSDVFMVFGVSLGWMVILAVGLGFLAAGFSVMALIHNHGWRRVLAALAILLTVLSTALRIDIIYGEFTTVGSIFSVPIYPNLTRTPPERATMSVEEWRNLSSEGRTPSHPAQGRTYTTRIVGTESNFHARPADIYLPPAALSAKPPALPVFVLLAGQPGSPDRLFTAGGIQDLMDSYAARHNGLAPIVVSPDQNGSSTHNTLCVDSPVYGNAETYLSRDVPAWIRRHLPVAAQPSMWAIGGFSQGGTCSTQLGPRHPRIYGNMLPADGELEPTQGNQDQMIKDYFGGDRAKFLAQVPTRAIAAKAPSGQALFTAAGSMDPHSQKNMMAIAKAAKSAGMTVEVVVAQGSGHDWHTVRTAWKPGLEWLGERMGLGPMDRAIEDHPNITRLQVR